MDSQTRPVQQHNETLQVYLNLYITHIIQVDEKREVLSLNCWFITSWEDQHFQWNPDDYGGTLKYLPVPTGQIWMPDIYLLNNAANQEYPFANTSAIVSYHGEVFWVPPATFHSVCPLDLKSFPFDEQVCKLQFVSWHHWGNQLQLNVWNENFTITEYMYDEHNEWEVVSSHGNRSVTFYEGYPDAPYIIAEFWVHLRRRAPYYRLALVTPVATAMLATAVTFWLPPGSNEKFAVGATSQLALLVLVVHVYWVVPRSGSNVPGIVVVCGTAVLFSGLSLLVALVVTSLARKKHVSAPPAWLSSAVSGWASVLLCLPSEPQASSGSAQLLTNEENDEYSSTTPTNSSESGGSKFYEWFLVATAIDRICFVVYCIVFGVLLITAFS